MTTDPFRPLDSLPAPDRWDEVSLRAQDPNLAPVLDLHVDDHPTRHLTRPRVLVAAAAVIVLMVVGVAAFGSEGSGEAIETDTASQVDTDPVIAPTEVDAEPDTTAAPTTEAVAAPTTDAPAPTTEAPADPAPANPAATGATPATAPIVETPPAASPPPPPAPTTPPAANRTLVGPCALHFAPELGLTFDTNRTSPTWTLNADSDDPHYPPLKGIWGPDDQAMTGYGQLSDGSVTFEIAVVPAGFPFDIVQEKLILDPNPARRAALTLTTPGGGWPGAGAVGQIDRRMPDPSRYVFVPPADRNAALATTTTGAHPNSACRADHLYIAAVGAPGVSPATVENKVVEIFRAIRPGPQ